jgi:hypothetical protein
MEHMIIGCTLLLGTITVKAQTFSEWFNQNSTRLKYYGQQIAAFQVYIGELEKGNRASAAGLGAISASKKGEYDLHNGYYSSLGEINPVLGKMGEVAEIVRLQAAIIQRFTNALARYRAGGFLGPDQVIYIWQTYRNVLQAVLADVTLLMAVLTAYDYQMTDDQRMGRIRELDMAMRDRYAFTLAFTDGTDLLEQQQAAELAEVGNLKAFYGVP